MSSLKRIIVLTVGAYFILSIFLSCVMPRDNPFDPKSITNQDDDIPPQIVSISPADDEEEIELDAVIEITFSETMDPASVMSRFTLMETSLETEVFGDFSWFSNGTVLTFSPDTNFKYYEELRLTLLGGYTDPSRNELELPIQSEFRAKDLAGEADPSFSIDGLLIEENIAGGDGFDYAYGIIPDGEGRFLITGRAEGDSSDDMFLARYFFGGTLDTNFGDFGTVVYDNGVIENGYDCGYALVIDDDGAIIVAGSRRTVSDTNEMAIWKFDQNGVPVSSFGDEGIVTFQTGSEGFNQAYDIIIDNLGRLVAVGTVRPEYNTDLALWRFNSDGTPDAEFGTNGFVSYDNPGANKDYGSSIVLDGDGKILVCGYISDGDDYDMALWRFNDDGTLDTGFSTDGVVTHNNSAGGDGHDYGTNVDVSGTGRIIVSGWSENIYDKEIVLWCYTSTGSLYSGFGTGGIARCSDNVATSMGYDFVFDQAERILVAGCKGSVSGGLDTCLWRFGTNGVIDSGFGADGEIPIDSGIESGYDDLATEIILDETDRPIICGYLRYDSLCSDVLIRQYR